MKIRERIQRKQRSFDEPMPAVGKEKKTIDM